MNALIESGTTYATAAVVLAITTMTVHAPAIMTLGGLVLLVLRLYVDGKRALKVWRGHYDH